MPAHSLPRRHRLPPQPIPTRPATPGCRPPPLSDSPCQASSPRTTFLSRSTRAFPPRLSMPVRTFPSRLPVSGRAFPRRLRLPVRAYPFRSPTFQAIPFRGDLSTRPGPPQFDPTHLTTPPNPTHPTCPRDPGPPALTTQPDSTPSPARLPPSRQPHPTRHGSPCPPSPPPPARLPTPTQPDPSQSALPYSTSRHKPAPPKPDRRSLPTQLNPSCSTCPPTPSHPGSTKPCQPGPPQTQPLSIFNPTNLAPTFPYPLPPGS